MGCHQDKSTQAPSYEPWPPIDGLSSCRTLRQTRLGTNYGHKSLRTAYVSGLSPFKSPVGVSTDKVVFDRRVRCPPKAQRRPDLRPLHTSPRVSICVVRSLLTFIKKSYVSSDISSPLPSFGDPEKSRKMAATAASVMIT